MKTIFARTVYNPMFDFIVEVPDDTEIVYGGMTIEPYSALEKILNHDEAYAYADWCDENGQSDYMMHFEELDLGVEE